MSALQTMEPILVPANLETLDKINTVYEALQRCEQVPLATEHLLHGGMYSRTIRVPSGVVVVGSLIKLATVLVVHGAMQMLVGDTCVDLDGYNVLPGSAGRKALFVTRELVEMTMIFPTRATTVEQAENEVFAEADLLMSRSDASRGVITITGE